MNGPGDPATWPTSTRHPNDPRNDGDDECPACGQILTAHDGCGGCGWLPPEPDYGAHW